MDRDELMQEYIEQYVQTPNGRKYDYAKIREENVGFEIHEPVSRDRRPDFFIACIDERGLQAIERGRQIEAKFRLEEAAGRPTNGQSEWTPTVSYPKRRVKDNPQA